MQEIFPILSHFTMAAWHLPALWQLKRGEKEFILFFSFLNIPIFLGNRKHQFPIFFDFKQKAALLCWSGSLVTSLEVTWFGPSLPPSIAFERRPL